MAVHEAHFELANDRLAEVVRLDSTLGLGWAYLAVVDLFLFRDPEASAEAAREHAESGRWKEQTMVEILIAYANQEPDRAEQLLYEFDRRFPDDPFSQHLLGQIQIDLGQAEQAVETIRELLRRHPDFHPAWNHLGHAFLAVGDLLKAGAAFGMFLELSPANPSAYDSMARYLVVKGDPEAAVEHLKRALEYEPRMAYGWMHMGDILAETGSAIAAEQAYVRALEASLLYGEDFREFVSKKIDELPLE
jgi:Flp pilus assembly protein TadD